MLLARLFFFSGGMGGPPAGLRKENGKMKIKYAFVTGEVSEIEVEDSIGELLVDFDRQEYNSNHRETRRHISLDGMEYEGELFVSGLDTAGEIERREDMARLFRALDRLSPAQRDLVLKVYFENVRIVDIARAEGVSEAAVRNRLKKIYAKLKKILK